MSKNETSSSHKFQPQERGLLCALCGYGIEHEYHTSNTKLKLTKFQAEELRERADVRADSVVDDPESGDAFENTPGALAALHAKLKPGVVELTPEELAWCREETDNLREIASGQASKTGAMEYLSSASSLSNLASKLN